jgi:hypothetical protein
MAYDPESDPRHLPDVSERILERVQAEVAERSEQIASYIHTFAAIEALYDTEGWAHLMSIVRSEADQLDSRLISDTDINTWRYHRGQRSFADFILTLPQLTSDKLRDLRGAEQRLARENEELQDRLGGG